MRRALVIAGFLTLAPAVAQVSDRPDSVRVTVYHAESERDPIEFRDPSPDEGLAFISETRTIDVPAGPASIEFRGVASTIIPQTVAIDGLPVPLIERNFDYDLLSPGSLLAKSVGETVTLVRTDKKTGKKSERQAVIRTGPNGVVLDFGGTYEALGCSGLKESLVFSKVPEGLRDTPTLSIKTNAPSAGRYTVTLSYLATHVNWGANYVARLNGDHLDLTGWVTLVNGGETGFKNVPLEIVAGKIERVEAEDHGVTPQRILRSGQCWPTDIRWDRLVRMLQSIPPPPAPPPPVNAITTRSHQATDLETVAVTGMRAAQDLGDYKLYSLNGSTDINAHQTKLVQLLEQNNVPFQRIYYFLLNNSEEQETASVSLRMKNTKKNNLGIALPAGIFTATEAQHSDAPVVLARTNFRDYAVDSPIDLDIGQAFDVYVHAENEPKQDFNTREGQWRRAPSVITIENHKAIPIDFELRLPVDDETRIASESVRHTVTAHGHTWTFHLAAGEKKQIRLTLDRKI